MNRIKRKAILKILNSGWSAITISYEISLLLNQPEEDILRIIQNLHWNRKHILNAFDNFTESKNDLRYLKHSIPMIIGEVA